MFTFYFFQGGSFYYDIAENPYSTIQWHRHHPQHSNPRLILPTRNSRGLIQDGL